MTEGGKSEPTLPRTLQDWERTLTRALLRADSGNTDAIRSFEITPETLAAYCGLGPEHAGAAEAAFKQALKADKHLNWCLQHGAYKTPNAEQPNCIAMLALTLLVDGLLDGVYENKGQFRAKLSEWLNDDRSFTNLRGVATMWKELAGWLDSRVAAGAPFRCLMLPNIPASWTHIGYTRYLSFPAKRDFILLAKRIGRSSIPEIDPWALLLQLDPFVRTSDVSHGLKAAYEDFRMALRSGAASVDHRFWRLVARARGQAELATQMTVSLTMEFDEDGARRYRVGETADGVVEASLSTAVASRAVSGSGNLGPSIRRGALFFRSRGLASWAACGEPPPGNGPFHLAVACRHAHLARGAIMDFVPSGSWVVTAQPIPAQAVTDVLRLIGITNAGHTVRTIGLVDGIRVGSSWLGQPRYLPYLEGASGNVQLFAVDGGTDGRLIWANGDLQAEAPVDGEFSIADAAGHWSRRASFAAVANVHSSLDAAAYALAEQTEWKLTLTKRCARSGVTIPTWETCPYNYQDVIEALYASSRSGLSEGAAIAIIGRAAGHRRWDMLRSLQEASFFDARLRPRWRGREFTLAMPTLTSIEANGTPTVIVSGAVPVRLELDFRTTVSLHGGIAFRRATAESFAPPMLGATGVEVERLSKSLDWPLIDAPIQPDGAVSNRLIETKVQGDGYKAASSWDWSFGRFRPGAVIAGPVRLTRLMHPGGRDHDIYRVEGKTVRSFHSRHAAILDAHAQAGLPLFRYEDGHLTRLASEGSLPLEISAILRVLALANGGGSVGGWSYCIAGQHAVWLTKLLPGLIDGLPDDANDAAMSYRRGRGARRPLWSSGVIAA